jgi:hypothetical protein
VEISYWSIFRPSLQRGGVSDQKGIEIKRICLEEEWRKLHRQELQDL